MAFAYTLQEHKEAVFKAHGNKLKVISTSYTSRNDIIEYKHTNCVHRFKRRADYVVQGSGSRCSECIRIRNENFKNRERIDRRIWNTEKYNKAIKKKQNNVRCLDEYINWNSKLKHNCIKHGLFKIPPSQAMRKISRFVCPKCSIEDRNARHSQTHEQIVKRIKYKHGDKVKLNEKYKGIICVQEFICDKGHIWKTTVDSVIRVSGCPKCCRNPAFSKVEKQWIKLMKRKVNPNIITCAEQPINIYLSGYKKSIRPDGYDPTTKTVYEFHGDYWHGNLKVKSLKNSKVGKLSMRDLNKKTRAREKALLRAGYKVVYCWEHDFRKYKKGRFYFRPVPFTVAKLTNSPYCH